VSYTIRAIDADEDLDMLRDLHVQTGLTFPSWGIVQDWWFAFFEGHPVAYVGLTPSWYNKQAAYLARVGVLKAHRGNALQLRLMQTAIKAARKQGFLQVVSDTEANPPSTNNFIRAKWHTFIPVIPWAKAGSIYWRKLT